MDFLYMRYSTLSFFLSDSDIVCVERDPNVFAVTDIQHAPGWLYGNYGQSVGSQSVTKSFVDGINYKWARSDQNI